MRKSESCIDPHTGTALLEFDKRAEAVRAVKLDVREVRRMEPYQCPKCDRWHVRPLVDRGPIPNDATCLMCRGTDGRPKVSHPTYEAALEVAFQTPNVELSAYQCPHGRGWHLTKT